jgi:CheY-like chemotaxis protein
MNERVLIVDDDRDTADSLARLVTIFGFEALAVYDGHSAVEQAHDFRPDMAFIDIEMPGLDGYDTVIQLRQQREKAQLILVAVTGWTRESDKRRAYDCGFDLHVAKPMSIDTLKQLLRLLDPAKMH